VVLDYRKWWIMFFIYVLVFFSRSVSYFESQIQKTPAEDLKGQSGRPKHRKQYDIKIEKGNDTSVP
jgi:hypothetical protein